MTKPNIELIEDRVLLKKIEEKPTGGIEIPAGTATTSEHFKAKVICVGADCKKVKEGDTVLFKDGFSKLTLEGEEYHVVREGNVVVRIKNYVE